MTGVWKNVMNILIEKGELSKTELYEKAFFYNKTKFWNYLDKWEKEELIEVRKEGKKLLVSLSSPEKKLREFVKDWGKRLELYEKQFKRHFTALEKNLPIIDKNDPFTIVKSKQRTMELNKKDNTWRPTGKYQSDYGGRTWKTRKKPTLHFEAILTLLNNLYQQSSILNFQTNIIPEFEMLNKYQLRSNKLIEDYTRELEDLFRDKIDFVFVVNRIRTVMCAFIYRATLEAKMKS